jgi:hypothetical protein
MEGVSGVIVRVLTTSVALVGVAVGSGLTPGSEAATLSSCSNAALRSGASAELPDCRAYEQVSPLNKNGFAAYPTTPLPAQVSSSGEALAYLNYQAFPGTEGNTIAAGHVSTRTPAGWQTTELTPRVPKAAVLKIYLADYTFSSDLTQAIIQVPAMPLTPEATPFVKNLFRRNSSGEYSLVNSNPPAIPAEALCGPQLLATVCWTFADVSGFAGASLDFSHILFESNAQFTQNAPETGVESLYENTGGTVQLIGILPDGKPSASSTAGAGSSAFYESSFSKADQSVDRAMAEDGSHVIFQAPADGGEPDPKQNGQTEVYDRINGEETVEISKPAPGATPAVTAPEAATFQDASVDGSRIFFTSSAELTTASETGTANNSETLYEYNLQTKQLTDLTVATNPVDAGTGPMVQGVIGSSTDGAYVYFVANGQLIEGKGTDGQPNLYMIHDGGKPVFIATLSSESRPCRFISDSCVWSPFPAEREAYIAPDGLHITFMSQRNLSTINFPAGYNNTDQETGEADSQVYEYTVPTKPEGTGQLICASCDPSGAQPVGKALIGIGGISPIDATEYSTINTAFYHVRVLSDNGGRVFYAAPTSIETPYYSVFEYEHFGEGTCENAHGCQSRISSPSNTESDYFLGSSADGDDVYFATANRLAATDIDNLRDVYDARVNGGFPVPVVPLCKVSCYQPGAPISTTSPASATTGPSENLLTLPLPVKCQKGSRLAHGKCIKKRKKKKRKKKNIARSRSRAKSTQATRRPR